MNSYNKDDRVYSKRLIRKNRIINLLRRNGAMSKFQLSKATAYSPPIVAQLIAELEASGIVRNAGKGESIGGRPPIMMELIPEAGYIIGIDLEKDFSIGVMMDMTSHIINEIQIPTNIQESAESITKQAEIVINQLISADPIYNRYLRGIGIAMHGLIEKDAMPSLSNPQPYKIVMDKLSAKYGVPVFVENDAQLMALGEKWFGSGYNYSNFITLNLGYGIGAGIILDNRLYRGAHNHAGEIGHIIISDNEEICYCGNKGCLESVAGGWAIIKKGCEIVKQHPDSPLTKITNGQAVNVTVDNIVQAVKEGDPHCGEIFKNIAKLSGRAVATTINLFSPEAIIISGRNARHAELFFHNMCRSINQSVMPGLEGKFEIRLSSLFEKASSLGACAIVFQEIMQSSYEEVLQLV